MFEYMNLNEYFTEEELEDSENIEKLEKWKAQRIERGYADIDLRNLSVYISSVIADALNQVTNEDFCGMVCGMDKDKLELCAKGFDLYIKPEDEVADMFVFTHDGEKEKKKEDYTFDDLCLKIEKGYEIQNNYLNWSFDYLKKNFRELYF